MKISKQYYTLLLVLLAFAIALKVVVPYAVKSHINKVLALNKDYVGKVEEVDVSFFGSVWEIKNFNLHKSDESEKFRFKLASLNLEGVNLYKLLFKDELHLKNLELDYPELRLKDNVNDKGTKNNFKLPFRNFTASSFKINNGVFLEYESEFDTLVSFTIPRLVFSEMVVEEGKQFVFKSASQLDALVVNDFYSKLNGFENLRTKIIEFDKDFATIENLTIKTKYSKEELSTRISKERDYFDFSLKKLRMEGVDYSFVNRNSELSINTTAINNFSFEAYRDKLLKDDITTKSFYGEMLRSIPFNIDIDTISLKEGNLIYTEKIDLSHEPSKLHFANLEGKITNFSNFKDIEIHTKLKADLMHEAPIFLNYHINPTHTDDRFLMSGNIKNFDAMLVDEFLRTTMQATAKGKVDQMYFTFSGDKNNATGDLKMKYEDFELKILQKDLLKINKVLSFVGNLFVNDGSDGDAEGYRYGNIYTEPDLNKSFPNYVWVCIRDGMIKTVTGNGKKDKDDE